MNELRASCLMLLTSEDEIVLQKRSNATGVFFPGLWGPIGGGANVNESARDCILRECFEETGWVPSLLQPLFSVYEHCAETVFFSRVDCIQSLKCMEGERLQAFKFSALANLNISPYHKMIIQRFISLYNHCKGTRNSLRVLLYTKLLPPAFGGYVTAGVNLYRLLSNMWETTIVTDETLRTQHQADTQFDLLVFNSTYENSTVFDVLVDRCDQVWTYEHNAMKPQYFQEMAHRESLSNRVIVPSRFLQTQLLFSSRNSHVIKPEIVPLPIDTSVFQFLPHPIDTCIRFCTFCAVKPVRRLEENIKLIHQLQLKGYSCCYHIYGSIPFQGDASYFHDLQALIAQMQAKDSIQIRNAIIFPPHIASTMRTYDFYLDLSEYESYGQAKLEAISSGLGMIMSSCKNSKALLPEGSVFYDGDVKILSERLCQRLEQSRTNFSEELQLRKAARRHLDAHFSDSIVKKNVERLYRESI